MAVVAFKHWFDLQLIQGKNRHAADGGFSFYQKMHHAGNAYCTHEDLNNTFYKKFPMTDTGKNTLEYLLSSIKIDVKNIVAPLMINRSRLNISEHPVEHLTCVKVTADDIPWLCYVEDSENSDNPFSDRYAVDT